MNALEKQAITIIRDWNLRLERINNLKMKIQEQEYKITPSLSLVPGSSKGDVSNQVESYTFRIVTNRERLERMLLENSIYKTVFSKTILTEIERDLIINMAHGLSPMRYARLKNIEPNYKIYKIQNSAVSKLVKEYLRIKTSLFERING